MCIQKISKPTITILALIGFIFVSPATAQAPFGPAPYEEIDYEGFEKIFDGSLEKWDGDPTHWKARGDTIVGQTRRGKPITRNTFLIWRGGMVKDFDLKLEFRMNSTNSGIQYRSAELPGAGKWVMKGYQADFDFGNNGDLCQSGDQAPFGPAPYEEIDYEGFGKNGTAIRRIGKREATPSSDKPAGASDLAWGDGQRF